jgi:uncharacterized membrane protein
MDDPPKASNGRPKIRPPLSPIEWLLVLATFVGAIFTIVLLAVRWPALPASVPSHFGISGQPNAYGGKGTLIFLVVLAAALAIGLSWLCRYPWTHNYPRVITEENAARQYRLARVLFRWMGLEWVALFAYMEWTIIQAGLTNGGLGLWFLPIAVATLILTFLIYFPAAARAK